MNHPCTSAARSTRIPRHSLSRPIVVFLKILCILFGVYGFNLCEYDFVWDINNVLLFAKGHESYVNCKNFIDLCNVHSLYVTRHTLHNEPQHRKEAKPTQRSISAKTTAIECNTSIIDRPKETDPILCAEFDLSARNDASEDTKNKIMTTTDVYHDLSSVESNTSYLAIALSNTGANLCDASTKDSLNYTYNNSSHLTRKTMTILVHHVKKEMLRKQ